MADALDAAASAQADLARAQQDAADSARALEVAQQGVANAQSNLLSAYNTEKQGLLSTISQYQGQATGLRGYLGTLGGGSSNPRAQYGLARASLLATGAQAAGGDLAAMGRLQQQGTDFLSASRTASQTLSQYRQDRSLVYGIVSGAAGVADSKASDAVRQLAALDETVSRLIDINSGVLSVKDAIADLQGALEVQAKATADNTAKMAKILTNVTRDGNSLITEAA
jgi:hypothetical protein